MKKSDKFPIVGTNVFLYCKSGYCSERSLYTLNYHSWTMQPYYGGITQSISGSFDEQVPTSHHGEEEEGEQEARGKRRSKDIKKLCLRGKEHQTKLFSLFLSLFPSVVTGSEAGEKSLEL